jgi:hypothetical protein
MSVVETGYRFVVMVVGLLLIEIATDKNLILLITS